MTERKDERHIGKSPSERSEVKPMGMDELIVDLFTAGRSGNLGLPAKEVAA
jgi:hypothetical protein